MHGHAHGHGRNTWTRRFRDLVCGKCGGIMGNHKPWCSG